MLEPEINDDDPIVAQRVRDLLHPGPVESSVAKRMVELRDPTHRADRKSLDDEDIVQRRMKELLNPSAPSLRKAQAAAIKTVPKGQLGSVEPSCAVVNEQQRAEVMWMCHVLSGLRRLFAGNVAKKTPLFVGVEQHMFSLVPRKVRSLRLRTSDALCE